MECNFELLYTILGYFLDFHIVLFNVIFFVHCCNLQERPGTESWVDLDKQQIPLLLNYAQCKLQQGETTLCINHCTEVLEKIDGQVVTELANPVVVQFSCSQQLMDYITCLFAVINVVTCAI